VFEQQRGNASSVELVVNHERGFCLVTSRPAFVTCPGHELILRLDCQRDTVDHVDVGEVIEFAGVQFGLG
jgi:hypothetical protein